MEEARANGVRLIWAPHLESKRPRSADEVNHLIIESFAKDEVYFIESPHLTYDDRRYIGTTALLTSDGLKICRRDLKAARDYLAAQVVIIADRLDRLAISLAN